MDFTNWLLVEELATFVLSEMIASDETFDRQLLDRIKEGDRQALDELIAKWQPRIRNWASRSVGRDADDLSQDVMYRVVRSLNGNTDPNVFHKWIWTIARNRVKDYAKYKKRFQVTDEPEATGAIVDRGEKGIDGARYSAGARSREEIPGTMDERNANWGMLHKALDALSGQPEGQDSNKGKYGFNKWQLAALAIRLQFGIALNYNPDTGDFYSVPGESNSNLEILDDFVRQRGEWQRNSVKTGPTFSLPDSLDATSKVPTPDYKEIEMSGKGRDRMMQDKSGSGSAPVQTAGMVAIKMGQIIRNLAQKQMIPARYANIEPPNLSSVKAWIQQGMDFMGGWLSKRSSKEWEKVSPRKAAPPNYPQRAYGDPVDYSNVGAAYGDINRTSGNKQVFKASRGVKV